MNFVSGIMCGAV